MVRSIGVFCAVVFFEYLADLGMDDLGLFVILLFVQTMADRLYSILFPVDELFELNIL